MACMTCCTVLLKRYFIQIKILVLEKIGNFKKKKKKISPPDHKLCTSKNNIDGQDRPLNTIQYITLYSPSHVFVRKCKKLYLSSMHRPLYGKKLKIIFTIINFLVIDLIIY